MFLYYKKKLESFSLLEVIIHHLVHSFGHIYGRLWIVTYILNKSRPLALEIIVLTVQPELILD